MYAWFLNAELLWIGLYLMQRTSHLCCCWDTLASTGIVGLGKHWVIVYYSSTYARISLCWALDHEVLTGFFLELHVEIVHEAGCHIRQPEREGEDLLKKRQFDPVSHNGLVVRCRWTIYEYDADHSRRADSPRAAETFWAIHARPDFSVPDGYCPSQEAVTRPKRIILLGWQPCSLQTWALANNCYCGIVWARERKDCLMGILNRRCTRES